MSVSAMLARFLLIVVVRGCAAHSMELSTHEACQFIFLQEISLCWSCVDDFYPFLAMESAMWSLSSRKTGHRRELVSFLTFFFWFVFRLFLCL